MLVTRQCEPEHNPWSVNKFDPNFHKLAATSPGMSSFETPLTTQPDWQGQYSFMPPGENPFSQSYEQQNDNANTNGNVNENHSSSGSSNDASAQPRTTAADTNSGDVSKVKEETSPLGHRRNLDPLGLRKQPSPVPNHTEQQQQQQQPHQPSHDHQPPHHHQAQQPQHQQHQQQSPHQHPHQQPHQHPHAPHHQQLQDQQPPPHHHAEPYPLKSIDTSVGGVLNSADNDSAAANRASAVGQGQDAQAHAGGEDHITKEEDDEDVDDLEMGEGEEGADGVTRQPQTAAERTAQKRKMKRFRLTHQQTRFLMSEFAKQPHPDAAHRERLSREIPGLSPRQVQVWFQNRRAKIKRLTADDRDRMMKMRAVPDDFDNVQALHSPYGAVHGIGTPITSPVDFGLSPAFGSIGFAPSATMSNPDLLSPLSPTANDRYGSYSNHMSTPLSAGPRTSTSNPFSQRQGSLDMGSRQQMRTLQPLQLRDTMNRSRSDSIQSPLRTSMSWKGNSLDYNYSQTSNGSPQIGGRHDSNAGYGPSSTSNGMGYDSSQYPNNNSVQSPSTMNNYSMHSTTQLQQAPQNRSRLRAASATLPMGLDLRNQYRSVSALEPVQQSTAPTPRAPTTQFGTSSTYTTSFPSAPLTAPIDFSMPRSAAIATTQDYSMPQMSAPIAPPNDFSQAFRHMGNSSSTRTPMRDSFGGGGPFPPTSQPGGATSMPSDTRQDEYSSDHMGGGGMPSGGSLKRKRSFGMPQGGPTPTSAPQPYGTTT